MTAQLNHTIADRRCSDYGRCKTVSVWKSAVQDERRVVSLPIVFMDETEDYNYVFCDRCEHNFYHSLSQEVVTCPECGETGEQSDFSDSPHVPTPWMYDSLDGQYSLYCSTPEGTRTFAYFDGPEPEMRKIVHHVNLHDELLALARDFESTCVNRIDFLRYDERDLKNADERRDLIDQSSEQLEEVRRCIAKAEDR